MPPGHLVSQSHIHIYDVDSLDFLTNSSFHHPPTTTTTHEIYLVAPASIDIRDLLPSAIDIVPIRRFWFHLSTENFPTSLEQIGLNIFALRRKSLSKRGRERVDLYEMIM
jgi:hypothetical protein